MTIPLGTLTDEDRERVRYHLGYLETSFAGAMQFGIPKPIQTMFLLEQALGLLVNQYAINRVVVILNTLDSIEMKLANSTCVLVAEQMGDLKLRGAKRGETYPDLLEREYTRWAMRLADIFGVPVYAYSTRFRRSGPGTSVPVAS